MTWLSHEPSRLEIVFVGAVFVWAYAAFVLYAWRNRQEIADAVAACFPEDEDGGGESERADVGRRAPVDLREAAERARLGAGVHLGSAVPDMRRLRERVTGVGSRRAAAYGHRKGFHAGYQTGFRE